MTAGRLGLALLVAAIPACGAASPAPAREPGEPGGLTVNATETLIANQAFPGNFTGEATVTPFLAPTPALAVSGASVSFEPGARTVWHSHPAGQTLYVTAGTGWVQQWGGAKREVKAGDVIWTPPGVKHWHGATDATAMTHIAIQGLVDGKNVAWAEPVSDADYRQP
ncbi:MAG: cupin domain-containing protein [Kofleriaceae bacterium]|nr:cupin domain-containing protein [Myxococcales bacterium]MCB9562195.1 cupin domain-containing protein [Kofleriaceae bacterium]